MSNRLDFARSVLSALGAPDTPDNEAALLTVMWAEQTAGQNAVWNPFNIQAGDFPHTGTSGSGQYNFASLADGATQTAAFLRQGYYTGIVAALMAGNSAPAVLDAWQQSPWAGSHYGYGLVDQLAGTLADWASRVNGGIAGSDGTGSLGGGGAGVTPGGAGGGATAAVTTAFNPLDPFASAAGVLVQPILKGALRIVLIGVGVTGGIALIVLGVRQAAAPTIARAREQAAQVAGVAAAVA